MRARVLKAWCRHGAYSPVRGHMVSVSIARGKADNDDVPYLSPAPPVSSPVRLGSTRPPRAPAKIDTDELDRLIDCRETS